MKIPVLVEDMVSPPGRGDSRGRAQGQREGQREGGAGTDREGEEARCPGRRAAAASGLKPFFLMHDRYKLDQISLLICHNLR